ncbi:nuclease [Rhizina undulata]
MSKATLGIIAAASAATGAAATALYYSATSSQKAAQIQIPAPVTSAPLPSTTRKLDIGTSPVDPAGLFKYGFPGPVNDIASRTALVSSFDRRLRNPIWVAEHITPESLSIKGAERHDKFLEDEDVPERFRAKLNDYRRSGYDRGHQVPAADAKFSQQAMDETFYLTNMCPQVGTGFNRDYWAHFEDFCRRLTKKYPSVRIVTGPLYLPRKHPDGKWRVSYEVIGEPANVAVPTHFFKVILAEDGTEDGPVAVGAFVLPNAAIHNSTKLTEFVVPLEAVERASGLEFLSKLSPNKKKELCKEIDCSIIVREFNNSRKNAALPAPKL